MTTDFQEKARAWFQRRFAGQEIALMTRAEFLETRNPNLLPLKTLARKERLLRRKKDSHREQESRFLETAEAKW